jgi:glycosyltransferase involved in cell wall biosynthesis
MPTLSLAMIVRNEADTIERVLSDARSLCDELIVVDTGSVDDTAIKAAAAGARVYHFPWADDFSAARNFSFTQCTKDWILWLDGDDTITPENQQRLLKLKRQTLSESIDAVYIRYVYPPFIQWRERLIRRALFGKALEWRNAIHECINGIDSEKVAYFENISIQHAPPDDRHAQKKDRNITILRQEYAKGIRDERTLYIYACECLNNLYRDEGEAIIPAFFDVARYAPYKYEIYGKMYDFYMHFEEPERAVDALGKAIATEPTFAEAYFKLGQHVMDKRDDPRGSIPLLRTAAAIPLPKDGNADMAAYTYGPWESLCRAYFRLEDYGQAKEMALKALEHDPPHSDWLTGILLHNTGRAPTEALPDPWQEWLEGNSLKHRVPNRILIRMLEKNHFSAGQIIAGLAILGAKANKDSRHGHWAHFLPAMSPRCVA